MYSLYIDQITNITNQAVEATKLLQDIIAYPGQLAASHLHAWFGTYQKIAQNSPEDSLRQTVEWFMQNPLGSISGTVLGAIAGVLVGSTIERILYRDPTSVAAKIYEANLSTIVGDKEASNRAYHQANQAAERVKSQNSAIKLLGQSLTVIGTMTGAVLGHNSFRF